MPENNNQVESSMNHPSKFESWECLTVLIDGNFFHDIGVYIWKIFPCIRILSSITGNISFGFFDSFKFILNI